MKLPVYEPREDSFLIVDASKDLVSGKVLEVGFGSGYVCNELSKLKNVKEIFGVDINPAAIKFAKEKYPQINFILSDLFENVDDVYDYIICNPPYLPQDKGIIDPSLYGGRKGYEFIEKLLSQVEKYLNDDGKLILLFSSLSKKEHVEKFIRNNFFEFKKLAEKPVGGFETLYVYSISKRKELIELKKKGVKNIKYFSKGRRGFIFTGKYKSKKVGIKIQNDRAETDSMFIESNMLKEVNKEKIGPKILVGNPIIYEFFEGIRIYDWVETHEKKEIIPMLIEVFNQLRTLDKMMIDKKEMSNPHKHILVSKEGNVCIIDYERARKDDNPSNVNGFSHFVISSKFGGLLKSKGINIDKDEIIELAKNYKKSYKDEAYNKLIELIK